jgi:hypothetical protein
MARVSKCLSADRRKQNSLVLVLSIREEIDKIIVVWSVFYVRIDLFIDDGACLLYRLKHLDARRFGLPDCSGFQSCLL